MKKLIKRPVSRPKRRVHGSPVLQDMQKTMTLTTDELAEVIRTAIGEATRPPRYTRIEEHTAAQLEAAISMAAREIPNFFKILHGIDAYMERRKRKQSGQVGHFSKESRLPFGER